MTLSDVVVVFLVLTGAAFSLLAGIGIVRMPDLYMRMQSATKAGTLGVACIVLAAAVHFATASAIVEASLIILFLFATAPIATHLIARASYDSGIRLWHRTSRNDLSPSRPPDTQE